MVDYLRSCYSTTAILDRVGTVYPIDWYWCDAGAPKFPGPCFASLNWIRPNYGDPNQGEIPTATRTWRDGSKPSYLSANPGYARGGLALWFATGAPGPSAGPGPINFRGQRTAPAGGVAASFAPYHLPPFNAPLTSSASGPLTYAGVVGFSYGWVFNPARGLTRVEWGNPGGPYWYCYPNDNPLYWLNVATGGGGWFRMVSYNSSTHVSVWDDPDGGILAPGETLSLTAV